MSIQEPTTGGLTTYFKGKIDSLEIVQRTKESNLRRLQAQRNELNAKGAQSCRSAADIRAPPPHRAAPPPPPSLPAWRPARSHHGHCSRSLATTH
jgi:hypothetical protein